MTPRHTRLDNVRVVNLDDDPECTECGCPLSERPIAAIVVYRNHMFCDVVCRTAWLEDHEPISRPLSYYRPDVDDRFNKLPPPRPGTAAKSNAELNKEFHGPSVGREVATAAVNVIGFVVWLIIISFVAGVIGLVWHHAADNDVDVPCTTRDGNICVDNVGLDPERP